jgi:hypothetical protein
MGARPASMLLDCNDAAAFTFTANGPQPETARAEIRKSAKGTFGEAMQ